MAAGFICYSMGSFFFHRPLNNILEFALQGDSKALTWGMSSLLEVNALRYGATAKRHENLV